MIRLIWTLALCLACAACSTMPPFTVEEHFAEAGAADAASPLDAGRSDAGSSDAGRFDGGGFDAGRFDGGFPDAAVDASSDALVDFDYECSLYGISQFCRSAQVLPPNCSGAPVGDVCFNLPGFGFAQMYECQQNTFGERRWTPTHQARCAHNCPVELPSASFFSLSTTNCRSRPALLCESGSSGTTQEPVDAELFRIAQSCGLSSNSGATVAGISLDSEGCPEWFHSNLARVHPMQRQCLTAALEALRFDCTPECAVTSVFELL